MLTLTETAQRLGVCTETVRRYIKRKMLVAYHYSRRNVRIKESDLEAFMARCRIGGAL